MSGEAEQKHRIVSEVYKLITVCMGMIGCLTSCFFPYKGLLNFLYGLNGYMGFLLIIFMVVHDVKRLIKMNL